VTPTLDPIWAVHNINDHVSNQPVMSVYNGQVLDGLRRLPSNSVHVSFTSVPYWLVRDYGVQGQLGREKTLEEHLRNLVDVFRELRRVLHPWGTSWVNYGDVLSQNGKPITEGEQLANERRAREKDYETDAFGKRKWNRSAGTAKGSGLAEKQLLLLPERLALELQRDGWDGKEKGWWLRSQVVWHKGGGNGESAKDRPSRNHEMVYMFTKAHRYFYDDYAVRQNMRIDEEGWIYGAKLPTVWKINSTSSKSGHPATFPPELPRRGILLGSSCLGCCPECLCPVLPTYVKRQTPDLEAQRRAGGNAQGEYHGKARRDYSKSLSQDPSEMKNRKLKSMRPVKLVGGRPSCRCLTRLDQAVPCRVLDPFSGEGTTGDMALANGRFYTGLELNPKDVEFQLRTLGPRAEQWRDLRAGAR